MLACDMPLASALSVTHALPVSETGAPQALEARAATSTARKGRKRMRPPGGETILRDLLRDVKVVSPLAPNCQVSGLTAAASPP